MKKRVYCILLASTILMISAAKSQAAEPDFRDEAGMKHAIMQVSADPHATYLILRHAYDVHLEQYAADYYYELGLKKPGDAYLESAFTFSQFMVMSFWIDHSGRLSKDEEARIGRQLGIAHTWRLDALKRMPNSPAVLVETAVYFIAGFDYYSPDHRTSYEMICKAIKLDPYWADAYKWKAFAISCLTPDSKLNHVRAKMMIDNLTIAERLDTTIASSDLLQYAIAYGLLDQPVKELSCLDTALQTHQYEMSDDWFNKWRASVAAIVAKQAQGQQLNT